MTTAALPLYSAERLAFPASFLKTFRGYASKCRHSLPKIGRSRAGKASLTALQGGKPRRDFLLAGRAASRAAISFSLAGRQAASRSPSRMVKAD